MRWRAVPPPSASAPHSTQVLAHEYGHYVNWSYGGFSSECSPTDNGYALSENLATSIAVIYIADDDQTLARYDSIGGMLGNLPSAHLTATNALQWRQNCSSDLLDRQSVKAFTAALW